MITKCLCLLHWQCKIHRRQFRSPYGFKINLKDQARIRDTESKFSFGSFYLPLYTKDFEAPILELLILMQERNSLICYTSVQKLGRCETKSEIQRLNYRGWQ